MSDTLQILEHLAKDMHDEWVCNSRRGLEYPGNWEPWWGPMPEGWIKETCGQDNCPYCGQGSNT